MVNEILCAYLVLISGIGFAAMGRDKRAAAAGRARTPERRLFAYALLGGSVGTLAGMWIFRHKTKHLKFTLGMPAILLLQILAVIAAVTFLR